jgi:NAD(P)-dependent dehydrogenase (short-subunit alcohol dehydrogenase family)
VIGGYILAGKVVFVTGGARGIGLETARIAHGRGASVVIADLDQGEAEAAAKMVGHRAIGVAADVRDLGQLESAVEAGTERFGGIDVVVANAGITPPFTSVAAIEPEDWERVMAVNLFGVWNTVRAGIGEVLRNDGQFVLVSSSYAFANGVLNSSYATAKAGVEALGRSLRAELIPRGASATVAYFGFIRTDMVRNAFDDPIVDRMRREALPAFLTRQVPVEQAGRAIVNGIEHRSPRVIAPFEWRLMFALRGLMGPFMDRGFERDPRIAGYVREAEQRSVGNGG